MRIFALETNTDKLKEQFLSPDEREVVSAHYHAMRFFGTFFWTFILTVLLVSVVIWLFMMNIEPYLSTGVAVLLWVFLVFPKLFRAFIDWKFDFVMITTDKVVIVDQSSIFKRRVTPVNLETLASIAAETQWANMFHFGILHLDLLEGAGVEYNLRFIKHAQEVASKIAGALTNFQRRKDLRRYPHGDVQLEQA
jgi:hypothetical protein